MDLLEDTITLSNCPDCGTHVNEVHRPGCDVERCTACGQQRITCGCNSDHTIWTGEWPETLQDVKVKHDSLLGMKSGWTMDYGHHPSVVYQSPTGFPYAVGTIYKGIGDEWKMSFEPPLSLQQDWLKAHAPSKQQKEIDAFRRTVSAAKTLKESSDGCEKWVGKVVKIGFDTTDEEVTKEWMWVRVVSLQSSKLDGILVNQPAFANVKIGASVSFTEDEIAAVYEEE